jgi:hypothetical protein
MYRISAILTVFAVFFALLAFSPRLALAQNCDDPQTTEEALRCGSSHSSGVPVTQDPEPYLQNVVRDAINILSVVVGVVAVFLIIFAGFRYITSSGDAARVATAKNALIYAIVGLIIAALAQIIVRFVLNETTNPTSSSSSSSPPPSSGPPPAPPSGGPTPD